MTKFPGIAAAALLCFGCASAVPTMRAMPVEDDVYLYFIPPSAWIVPKAAGVSVSLDITYRSERDIPAVCNISFFGAKRTPGEASAVAFTGGEDACPLRDVKIMFVSPDKNELRITSSIPIEDLRKALEAEALLLQFTLDVTRCTAAPPEQFLVNKAEFLSLISAGTPGAPLP